MQHPSSLTRACSRERERERVSLSSYTST
eukprot:COSAG03_NODE_19991_length_326_cov_0.907489_1_plen_28_part_01